MNVLILQCCVFLFFVCVFSDKKVDSEYSWYFKFLIIFKCAVKNERKIKKKTGIFTQIHFRKNRFFYLV